MHLQATKWLAAVRAYVFKWDDEVFSLTDSLHMWMNILQAQSKMKETLLKCCDMNKECGLQEPLQLSKMGIVA